MLIPISGACPAVLPDDRGLPHGRAGILACPRHLVVHHTPSPAPAAILEALNDGVAMVEEVALVVRPALSAGAADLLAADGVLLGTPANIGYMSGALKHFFDTVFYPCLDATAACPTGSTCTATTTQPER